MISISHHSIHPYISVAKTKVMITETFHIDISDLEAARPQDHIDFLERIKVQFGHDTQLDILDPYTYAIVRTRLETVTEFTKRRDIVGNQRDKARIDDEIQLDKIIKRQGKDFVKVKIVKEHSK